MYKTTVRTRKLLQGKEALKVVGPLGIWFISCMAIFLIAVKITYWAVPFMIIVFLCIIPVFCYCRKQAIKFRENSFVDQEVVFHVVDGELYKDDIKLNITKSRFHNEIYVDDITYVEGNGKYGGTGVTCTFSGTVQEPYLDGFIRFLNEHHIDIQIEEE